MSAGPKGQCPLGAECLLIGSTAVPLHLVRHRRARRYVLRLRRDGSARVTIPRGGSIAFAVDFARRNSVWIERQLEKRIAEARPRAAWRDGTEFLFHGAIVQIRV